MTTSVATDVDGTWKALLDGRSGIRKLEDPFVEWYDLLGYRRYQRGFLRVQQVSGHSTTAFCETPSSGDPKQRHFAYCTSFFAGVEGSFLVSM